MTVNLIVSGGSPLPSGIVKPAKDGGAKGTASTNASGGDEVVISNPDEVGEKLIYVTIPEGLPGAGTTMERPVRTLAEISNDTLVAMGVSPEELATIEAYRTAIAAETDTVALSPAAQGTGNVATAGPTDAAPAAPATPPLPSHSELVEDIRNANSPAELQDSIERYISIEQPFLSGPVYLADLPSDVQEAAQAAKNSYTTQNLSPIVVHGDPNQ